MNHDISKITATILEIENAINARWNSGDCTGFLEAYREDVTYFDPLTDRCLIGRMAVKDHFDKYFTGAPVVRSEQFDPKVVVNDAGDVAILTYNLQNHLEAAKQLKNGTPRDNGMRFAPPMTVSCFFHKEHCHGRCANAGA
ncbi:MAG: nuclear transport factor 2 family protein, partial [Pirellulales bacterium]